ncbi:AAA family ATPase [Microbacterium sp. RD1]|uniref:AAA family ATPase n=1 Tax=Microbacterium sp. RD1 TaxID=3457313 RepID=UPI003FA532E8
MRIVVSGTHASGKSTLISDFSLRHPEFTVLPDPFELVDETIDAPGAALFASQLRIAAGRLSNEAPDGDLIAERGPLDFLAYLLARAELTGVSLDSEFLQRASALTTAALTTVDVLILLPLAPSDAIDVGDDEHPELRAAMNDVLLELADDPSLVGDHLTIAEITGRPAARLAALEAVLARAEDRRPL